MIKNENVFDQPHWINFEDACKNLFSVGHPPGNLFVSTYATSKSAFTGRPYFELKTTNVLNCIQDFNIFGYCASPAVWGRTKKDDR